MQYNGNCDSQNPEFFDKFYGPNGESTLLSPTDFRGHTTVMTASAEVTPNELYHIKLVIADDGDTLFDSAVFLAAGSFDIGDLDLGDDILLTSGEANCEGDEVTLDAGDLPNNSSKAISIILKISSLSRLLNMTTSSILFKNSGENVRFNAF